MIASLTQIYPEFVNLTMPVMDMLFRDDECRIRKGNAPANFTTIKHMASNLLRLSKGNKSLRQKRHKAAWNEDYLCELITA